MGTVVSIEVPDSTSSELISRTCDWLHRVEALFSVFIDDSEVSRIARGDMSIDDANPLVRHVLNRCDELCSLTNGAFRHRNRSPERPIDPSGFVKGWSVERALLDMRISGIDRACIDAGGDIAGFVGDDDAPWRIGIRNPDDPDGVAAILDVHDGAVATSGEYERGQHIQHSDDFMSGLRRDIDRFQQPTSPLTSVSVVGPELGICDALATAIWADGARQGRADPPWLINFGEYDVLVCTADGRVRYSERLEPILQVGATPPAGIV